MRGPVIVALKIVPSSGRKPGGRNQVDAGGAAHLAAFEGKRALWLPNCAPPPVDLDNIRISGQPDSQEQRRVRSEAGRERRRG